MKVVRFLVLLSFLAVPLPSHAGDFERGITVPPSLTAGDIDDLVEFLPNVGHVRWQALWTPASTSSVAEYNAWLERALENLDNNLVKFKEYDIKVVFNLHTPPKGFKVGANPPMHNIFVDLEAKNAFVATWKMIAERYKDETQIVGFDLLNEPARGKIRQRVPYDWNATALEAAQAIRSVNTRHPIIHGPFFGNPRYLNKLRKLPVDNVIYTVHMYFPNSVTQQGIGNKKLGVKYPKKNRKNRKKSLNRKKLVRHLRKAIKFERKHNVEMYIGEFSAVRWAPNGSAFRYLRDVINIFEKQGWDWTYHAFKEDNAWSLEHGDDINNNEPVGFSVNPRADLIREKFGLNP